MRGKVFFFTGASFCAIFFLEPSGNLLLEPSGSSWVPPDGSIFVFAIGSPPRMRGKGKNTHRTGRTARITPAYAGKRSQGVAALQLGWDHPRVCGEKPHLTPAIDRSKGSPPRMRGKAVPAALPDVTHGITPAYAGKSQSYRQPCSAMWDHPRVCGEKSKPKPGKDRRMESPPRVRGKGVRLPPLHVPAGITPAYAGKRLQNDKGNIYGRDHPRVCGEKGIFTCLMAFLMGSPPRMRGKV